MMDIINEILQWCFLFWIAFVIHSDNSTTIKMEKHVGDLKDSVANFNKERIKYQKEVSDIIEDIFKIIKPK